MLTRRTFVQTVGTGAAALRIGARGRENSLWAAFEPTLEAVAPGIDLPVEQREPARARARPCSTAIKAAFGPAGARPGRYDGTRAAR